MAKYCSITSHERQSMDFLTRGGGISLEDEQSSVGVEGGLLSDAGS